MKQFSLLLLTCCSLLRLPAQAPQRNYLDDPGRTPHDHPLDFTHLRLEIWPDGPAGRVTGKVTETFQPLRPEVDSFFLDAIRMTVRSLTLNGRTVRYHADSAGITVIPDQPLTWNTTDSLAIEYAANPRRGLYFIGFNDPAGLSRKEIWSQGEGVDNRYWIPLYDEPNDKLVSELLVHFDKTYSVLSNGRLLDKKDNDDGTLTWHYLISHPQASYLIMLGIGRYAIRDTQSVSGVPLHLYYYPDWKDRVDPTYQYSAAMIDFFEKEIGVKYPWESYSQLPVQDYMFGAMENTTATIFGDFYMVDRRGLLDRSYIAVNAHELAHQWFGDYVTARSDAHVWLQESFATYYNQLFEKEVLGEDHFEWERRQAGNAALESSKHDLFGVANSQSGGNRVYGKGAFVLDMLKYVVGGRETYNKAVRYYLEQHPYRNVDTHDLLVAFEESTGMDLHWFWDEWLDRGGEPDYHIDLDDQPQQTELVIAQHALPGGVTGYKDGLFRMPVAIELHYDDHTVTRTTRWVQHATEIVKVPKPAGKQLAFVLFDPGSRILKTVSFPKSLAMLQAQATGSPAMLDRYDALVALRSYPLSKKLDLLQDIYHRETFHALRTEALSQLGADTCAPCLAIRKEALTDKDVAVRKAALAAIDPYSPVTEQLLPELTTLLKDSSYDITETALRKLAEARPGRLRDYLQATKGVEGVLGRNVQVRWLELAYTAYNDRQYLRRLVELTSPSYEFRTRVNAMAALRRLDYFDTDLAHNLVNAILSPNTRLSGPASDLLTFFFAQDKFKPFIVKYVRGTPWEGWQQGLLHDFMQ